MNSAQAEFALQEHLQKIISNRNSTYRHVTLLC